MPRVTLHNVSKQFFEEQLIPKLTCDFDAQIAKEEKIALQQLIQKGLKEQTFGMVRSQSLTMTPKIFANTLWSQNFEKRYSQRSYNSTINHYVELYPLDEVAFKECLQQDEISFKTFWRKDIIRSSDKKRIGHINIIWRTLNEVKLQESKRRILLRELRCRYPDNQKRGRKFPRMTPFHFKYCLETCKLSIAFDYAMQLEKNIPLEGQSSQQNS